MPPEEPVIGSKRWRNGPGEFLLDGRSQAYEPGDTVAMAIVRGGAHPRAGGTLCLAGDCGNCVAEVDGIAYVRTCLTPARAELAVRRHPADVPPAWDPADRPVQPVQAGRGSAPRDRGGGDWCRLDRSRGGSRGGGGRR